MYAEVRSGSHRGTGIDPERAFSLRLFCMTYSSVCLALDLFTQPWVIMTPIISALLVLPDMHLSNLITFPGPRMHHTPLVLRWRTSTAGELVLTFIVLHRYIFTCLVGIMITSRVCGSMNSGFHKLLLTSLGPTILRTWFAGLTA